MRFGGHETFTIREGWLTKGLRVLIEEPARIIDEFAEDHLGVGRNMVKSIRHWLVATQLAEAHGSARGKSASYTPTELGQLIFERDPHMLDLGTWWIIHLNLLNNDEHAASWCWFFNVFGRSRFERPVCIEALHRQLRVSQKRVPSIRTIERDIACLLNSYAVTVPRQRVDPEDAAESPLSELGLLSHFKASGYYQRDEGLKAIAPQLAAYALAKSIPDATAGTGLFEITLTQASRQPGGPGRGFQLSIEMLFELFSQFAEEKSDGLGITGMAGERLIQLDRRPLLDWVREYYCHAREEQKVA